jgi:hypothetical protein
MVVERVVSSERAVKIIAALEEIGLVQAHFEVVRDRIAQERAEQLAQERLAVRSAVVAERLSAALTPLKSRQIMAVGQRFGHKHTRLVPVLVTRLQLPRRQKLGSFS